MEVFISYFCFHGLLHAPPLRMRTPSCDSQHSSNLEETALTLKKQNGCQKQKHNRLNCFRMYTQSNISPTLSNDIALLCYLRLL